MSKIRDRSSLFSGIAKLDKRFEKGGLGHSNVTRALCEIPLIIASMGAGLYFYKSVGTDSMQFRFSSSAILLNIFASMSMIYGHSTLQSARGFLIALGQALRDSEN